MFRKALWAVWATCVFTPCAASAAVGDIVIYSTDPAAIHGNWTASADPGAANGTALVSSDLGWSNTTTALAAPTDYVDFTFSAPAAASYRVWFRVRATGNSKFNDSLYAQFSDAIDGSGHALFPIGSTSGLVVNLAGDATGNGLSGWGWTDGAYWLTQTTKLAFANGGAHTVRIQTREDGVSIDQIVLSPAAYLTTPPGPASNDATIVPKTTSIGITSTAAATPAADVVRYAADASNLHGNWALAPDSTAAAGVALASAEHGTSNTAGPLVSPVDYFDVVFSAPAGTPFHVWFRMRATGDSKYNDSVFVQFSDAVTGNGTALNRIGTANALVLNLAVDANATNLHGWGWQDGAYWLTQPRTLVFATAGNHTLRVQTREDGVSIDQIVLSSTTYLNAAPGGVSSDTTIVPKPSSAPPPPVPTAPVTPAPGSAGYSAISDRNPYAKPPLPPLGPAGYSFLDPTFRSKMVRVTDGQTRPGVINRSFRVPSNAHLNAWNAASNAFYVISNDGTVIPYSFDATTMTASRLNSTTSGNGGLTLAFYVEPQFSTVQSNVIYGAISGTNNRTIASYNFSNNTYSTILNLDSIATGLTGYVGGVLSGGSPGENLLTFFGGASQDQHYYALWAPLSNLGGRKLLNTVASTLNGTPTAQTLNFHLHSAQIDRSGRFVFLYPTAVDLAAPRYAAQVYVWDTTTDIVTPVTSGGHDGAPAMHPSGHDAAGYGEWVNQDCCSSGSWDAAQWQFRELTTLDQTSDLISPTLPPKEIYLADHTTWNNAQPTSRRPVISSTYRYGNNTVPWRAWDDEIIGIETTNGGGGAVWRFAHHRSSVGSDADPTTPYFWYEPIANVSPDGKWVVFTSNWEKTLGTDSSEGTFRQDVFMVQLTPGS